MYKHNTVANAQMKMTIVKTIVCLLLASFSALAPAEVQPATKTTSTAGASDEIERQTAAPSNEVTKAPVLVAPKTASREQKDVFKPSEEISEDFAVPFPVDI